MQRLLATTVCLAGLAASAARVPLARAQALDAPSDVQVSSHRLDVSLEAGIAAVREELALARTGTRRAEVSVRVPLPASATLVSIRVCRARRCRSLVDGGGRSTLTAYAFSLYLPARGGGRTPIASARREPGGVALLLAPIDRAGASLELRYALPLTIHEGVARLVLPAPATTTAVSVTSPDLAELSVAGHGPRTTLDAGAEVAIEARVAAPIAALHRRGRGAGGRARVFAVAPSVRLAHDVILALDVSPSMQDVPSGRLDAAARAVLAALPEGSRVRVVCFGAWAEWASSDGGLPAWQSPSEIDPAAALAVGIGGLGSRTRYAPLAARVDEALGDASAPVVIVVGDGWLDGPDFRGLDAAGARIVVVNVADTATAPAVRTAASATPSTLTIDVGASLAGEDGTPVAAATAEPMPAVSLRAASATDPRPTPSGEPLAMEIGSERLAMAAFGARVRARRADWSVLPTALARETIALDPRIWGDIAKWDGGGPAPRRVPGGLGGIDDAITGAAYLPSSSGDGGWFQARRIAPPRIRAAQAEIRGTISAGSLRRVMRSLAPRVRSCFADARHGRPSWSARADVHVVLGHREVLAGHVTGTNVDAALAACIERGLDYLQVPACDDTTIAVNYPFYAPPLAPGPEAEPMDAQTRTALDAITGPFDADALDAEARALIATPTEPSSVR